jgi:hypothetical protein
MTQYTEPEPTDDPGFLEWVQAVVVGVRREAATDQTFVVKIDHWFGRRWLGFSGKALGAIGVRKRKLTLPPFVPSRVRSVRRFWPKSVRPGRFPRIHRWQRSGENLQRYVDVVVLDSHVFWYSGGTAHLDRASFMAYVSTPDGHWPWYVGLRRTNQWRVVETMGIGPPEIEAFRTRGLTSA